jgi:putative membrane protein
MRRPINYLLVLFKGMAMGAADVVPGVSGGTIAFISGIYEELLRSIKSINLRAIKLLFSDGLAVFWNAINGNFLLAVFGGVLISIFSLAKIISYGMENHPLLVWSFFFGLIVASIVWMIKQQTQWRFQEWLGLINGTLVAMALSFMPPMVLNDGLLLIFGSGALAICAMILPGISGSFILVLIGQYFVLIDAVNTFNVSVLATFGAGCVVGLLLFSRILSWLLESYKSTTLAVLIGFLIGSLLEVWPWKNPLEVLISDSGKELILAKENLSPWAYGDILGQDPQLIPAIGLMVMGLVVLLGLAGLGQKSKTLEIKS